MQIHPFDDQIASLQAREDAARRQRTELSGRLDWYDQFDPMRAAATRQDLAGAIEVRSHELIALGRQKQALLDVFRVADEQGAWKFDPRTWFASERAVARRAAARLATEIAELRRQIDELGYKNSRGEDMRTLEALLDAEIEDYRGYDAASARATLAQADQDLARIAPELGRLRARKQALDAALAGLWQELQRRRAQRASLERSIRQADQFDARLSAARDGRSKAAVHAACERQFGDGSPRRVRADLQRQLNSENKAIGKLEPAIALELRRAQLDVRAVIIDGSNVAYHGNKFIGLAALEVLVPALAANREVIINVDPGFQKQVGLSRHEIESRLQPADVHFVPKGFTADPFLMQYVDTNQHAYVVSNDKFDEFRHHQAIKEQRILNHAIINGCAQIPDLRISVPLRVAPVGNR